jgi:hypothetical protein
MVSLGLFVLQPAIQTIIEIEAVMSHFKFVMAKCKMKKPIPLWLDKGIGNIDK